MDTLNKDFAALYDKLCAETGKDKMAFADYCHDNSQVSVDGEYLSGKEAIMKMIKDSPQSNMKVNKLTVQQTGDNVLCLVHCDLTIKGMGTMKVYESMIWTKGGKHGWLVLNDLSYILS